MSIFSKLFGSKPGQKAARQAATGETYEGFTIIPDPIKEAGGYRLCARIEREVEGELKSHTLIRADVIASRDEAEAAALAKARQMIDEQGLRLLG